MTRDEIIDDLRSGIVNHSDAISKFGIVISVEKKAIQPIVNRYNWKHPRKKIAKWKVRKWRRFAMERQQRVLSAVLESAK